MREADYWIGEHRICLSIDGEIESGEPRVLLDEDDNLIRGLGWEDRGYTIEPFLSDADHARVCEGIKSLVRDELSEVGVATDASFTLERYHRYADTDERHASVIARTRLGFDADRFPVNLSVVESRLSEICKLELTLAHPTLERREFMVRIVRPGKPDNNPPHRDVWLDRLRHGVNIYVPVAGSDDRSSLTLVPGSHMWPEDAITRTRAGARIDGLAFSVPAVVGTKNGPLEMTRPNPGSNEVLVFTPYVIHGGAVNLAEDRTRVSLELRFWRNPA